MLEPQMRAERPNNWRMSLLGAAVFLIILGAGWLGLVEAGNDTGTHDEWIAELGMVYRPGVEGGVQWADFKGDLGATVWKWAWQNINGYWDARVLAFASGLGLALAWAWLWVHLLRVRAGLWMALALTAATVATLSTHELKNFWISGGLARSAWVLLTALGLIWGMQGRRGSTRWWSGVAIGALGVIGAAEGVALPLFFLSRHFVRGCVCLWRRSNGAGRAGFASGLALAGAWFWWWIPGQSWAATAYSWPRESVGLWLVIFLPAAARTVSGFFSVERKPFDALSALAGWSLLLPWICAALGRGSGVAMAGVLIPGVWINAACLADWWARREVLSNRHCAWVIGWALAACLLFVRVLPDYDRELDAAKRQENWAPAWRLDDVRSLAGVLRIDQRSAAGLLEAKNDPKWAALWAPSMRPPLYNFKAWAKDHAAGAFRLGGHPRLTGEPEGWPSIGTWRGNEGAGPGNFTGEAFVLPGKFIRVWLAGEWGPGAVDLVLRTETGRVLRPIGALRARSDRWVRLNFENPGEPARLELSFKDQQGWVAFCGPVSVTTWSWVVPKIILFWPWVLGGGLGLFILPWLKISWRAILEHPARIDWGRLRWLPWCCLAAYAIFMVRSVDTSAGGADSAGYLNAARMFSEGRLTMTPRALPGVPVEEVGMAVLTPLAFAPSVRPGEIAPITAPGFPLMCAGVGIFMPLSWAVAVVIGVNLVLGVFFTQRLAQAWGLRREWAWVAGFMVGLSPLYLYIGLQSLSDGPSLAWVTAAIYFAWQSRTRPGLAVAAGLATAVAVLTRPANVLVVLPVMVCFGCRWRQGLLWVLGGLPGAVFQFYFNWQVWGNPLSTGYGDVSDVISWRYLPGTLLFYAQWLPLLLSPVAILFPAIPWARRVEPAARLVLVVWLAVVLGFYGVFFYTQTVWWFLRFILPAFPAVVIAALLVARECQPLVRNWRWTRLWCRQSVLLVGVLGWLVAGVIERKVFFWVEQQRYFTEAGAWLNRNAAPGSTVLSVHGAGTVTYYTDLSVVLYYHDVVRESPAFAEALARGGQEVYAYMFHFERPGARPDFLGEWELCAEFQQGGVKIWRWLGLRGERRTKPGPPASDGAAAESLSIERSRARAVLVR